MKRGAYRRTVGLVALVVLAALATVAIRRQLAAHRGGASTPPGGSRAVPEIARAASKSRPVIFLGLDGADWDLLDRYMAAGSMPELSRLVREGSGGVLLSIHPPLSPLVWTTMMTGVGPLEHRILDFVRWNPVTGEEEPITSDERRAPAIWNMATYGGKRVASFGLWATYPAEPVNGLIVSDRLFSFLNREGTPPPGTVHPPGQEMWAREALARARAAVDFHALHAYLPWLEEAEYRRLAESADPYAHPVSALRRILIETRTYHALGTDWASREKPDLTIVYLEGTDSIGHVFAPYAPPRPPSLSEADYQRYGRVPESYFRFVDGLLGEYRKLAEASGAVIMLASDHGFRWSEGRPARLSSFAHATAAEWHRPEGIYVLWGPGIPAAPGHPHRGGVQQVCATLLVLLGLPPAVHGEPLPPLRRSERGLDYGAHYRPVAAAPTDKGASPDDEALEKLRALGYIGGERKPTPGRPPGSTRTAGSYTNEALILRTEGRAAEAIGAAERALSLDENQASALWCLSDLLYAEARELDRSDQLLVRAFASGLPRGISYVAARALDYQRSGRGERGLKLLAAASRASPGEADAWLALGRYRIDQGDCASALPDIEEAVRLAPASPASHASDGLVRLCLGEEEAARRRLVRGGTTLAAAHQALAAGALARGDLARAEREARLVAGDLRMELETAVLLAEVRLRRAELPQALAVLDRTRERRIRARSPPVMNLEFLRGDILARLGQGDAAEAAFKEEIRSFPENSPAYARLAMVYALQKRGLADVQGLLASMYDARPRGETALLAARTLESLGDAAAAAAWRRRAAIPGG